MQASAPPERRRGLALVLTLALVAHGCGLTPDTSAPASSPDVQRSAEPDGAGRIGLHPLVGPSSFEVGTIEIEQADDGTISIQIEIEDASQPHPWGIFAQDACKPPAPNRDAPFQFADIEDGRRTEQIEAQGYLTFPTRLTALIMEGDGAALYGCADLGLGKGTASPSPATDCDDDGSPSPPTTTADLAFSMDVLSDSEIHVMGADGANVKRLTSSLGVDMKPSWSPDGRRIAFRTQRDGNDEIYVMNADGTCQGNLTNDPVDDRSPAWSPDGRSIAFDHFFTGSIQDIAVIDVDGMNRHRVTTRSGEYPAWSPMADGSPSRRHEPATTRSM